MQPEIRHAAVRRRVLVTGIGGPAAQGFIAAFPAGTVDWFVADADPMAPGYHLHPISRRIIVPMGASADFADVLLQRAVDHGIEVIVPTVDAELPSLAASLHRFRDAGISVLMAGESTLDLTLDKWTLVTALEGRVPTPRTTLLDGATEPPNDSLPLIAKPRFGSGSRGIVLARSTGDLEHLPRDGSYIVQEYLPGAEYSIDVLTRRDGKVVAAVPRERLRVDSGIAVTARTVRDPELVGFGHAVAEAIQLVGVANVQCKRDGSGRPALLEVNPRFPGTMALTVAAGVNMPQLALADLLGEDIPERLDFADTAMVRTYQDHVVQRRSLETSAAPERRRGAA